MKLPNDLIKATDYEKAKERVIHEFECVNGKFIQHYVLGGEHELTEEEVVDCLNQQNSQISKLQASYKQVNEENKQLKLDCVIYKSTIDELNKSQKQLAIDVLERLHNDFASSIGNGMLRTYVCGLIKDKISELKGELK